MNVSVVVPTYNRRALVMRTLEKLFAQSLPPSQYEIITVVDGSTDGTARSLKLLQPACRFRVIEQQNRGPAAARNAGYKAAQNDLVLFIDDDMLCDSGLVAAHIAAHAQPDGRIAFGALFLSPDSPPSLAAECFNREIGALHLDLVRAPKADWLITDCVFSNASLSRSLLDEVGGFDEAFRLREDLELGIRLFNARVRASYLPNAIAYQYYEKTSADLIREAEGFAAADVTLAQKYPRANFKGQLDSLAQQSPWKRSILKIAASAPACADFILVPLCGLGQACFQVSLLRNMGVRALQIRRRIHWYRKARELGWRLPASVPRDAS